MNSNCCARSSYAIAITGALLIFCGLLWYMRDATRPEQLGSDRVAERRKALADLHASNEDVLNHYAWENQPKGIVRLPIDRAKELMESSWHADAAKARADLIARVEKATAVPPKAPEKPSQFE